MGFSCLVFFFLFDILILVFLAEVKLKEEHLVTVEKEQHNPHGPELSPIDPSFIGKHVTVTKTKGSGTAQKTNFHDDH